MQADAGLDTGFLIGADDVVLGTERSVVPGSRIQIQHASRLLRKLGIAGKDPTLIAPRFDGVLIQDATDGAGADRPAQGGLCQRDGGRCPGAGPGLLAGWPGASRR